jgi:PIN domain nuclease of toxin-antitoxin system
MNILLDTHTFLWAITDAEQLSPKAKKAFLSAKNQLFFSMTSYWEICIKLSLKKLSLIKGWEKMIDKEMTANAIQWLPIHQGHCLGIQKLPWIHKDPFDRLLIAQAKFEGLCVMTADKLFSRYPIKTLW